MTEKLLETKSWLENFSNRWGKVLVRSTCPSQNSRTRSYQNKKDFAQLQSTNGHECLPPAGYLDCEEGKLEDTQGTYAETIRRHRFRTEEIKHQQSVLDKVKQKTNSIHQEYSAIFQELYQENSSLKQSISKAKQSFRIPSILEDYERHLEYLKCRIEEAKNTSTQLAKAENQSSSTQKTLKSINKKLKKELSVEKEEYKRLYDVHKKLQMSKKCLRNIVSNNIKIKDKSKDTGLDIVSLKDEISRLNNQIQENIEIKKKVIVDIKEQKDLKAVLKGVLSKVTLYRDLADKANNTIQHLKKNQEDVGLVLLRDLRDELQRMKDVRRVDMCNQLCIKLNDIYQKKKLVVSKETCLRESVNKYHSQPPTHAKSFNRKSRIFSFSIKH